jgi:hypothetical protein
MRAKVARIPHVICHEVPRPDFEWHKMREMCQQKDGQAVRSSTRSHLFALNLVHRLPTMSCRERAVGSVVKKCNEPQTDSDQVA